MQVIHVQHFAKTNDHMYGADKSRITTGMNLLSLEHLICGSWRDQGMQCTSKALFFVSVIKLINQKQLHLMQLASKVLLRCHYLTSTGRLYRTKHFTKIQC